MVALKAWLLAFLIFNLSPEWQQTRTGCETVDVTIGPPGQKAEECTAAWTREGGAELYAFVWKPFPPRDGGPMVAVEEMKGSLLGEDITITRTSMFFGTEQEVLVAGLGTKTPEEAQILIYARNLSPEEFQFILSGIEREGSGETPAPAREN